MAGAMAGLQNHTPTQSAIYRRIVGAIAFPPGLRCCRSTACRRRLPTVRSMMGSCATNRWSPIPRRRRRGFARRVIASAGRLGARHGAAGACLEVEAGNAPARALYAGFRPRRALPLPLPPGAVSHIRRRTSAGDAAEDGAGHQAGAAGVVVVVEPADDLAGGEEAGDRRAGRRPRPRRRW